MRESPAFIRLDGIYGAEVVFGEIHARAIFATLQNQTFPVRGDFSLMRNEVWFGDTKKSGDSSHFFIGDAHKTVFDTATPTTSFTLELAHINFLN